MTQKTTIQQFELDIDEPSVSINATLTLMVERPSADDFWKVVDLEIQSLAICNEPLDGSQSFVRRGAAHRMALWFMDTFSTRLHDRLQSAGDEAYLSDLESHPNRAAFLAARD